MKFNTIKKQFALIIFVLSIGQINAQDTTETQIYQPPIPVEVMIGNNSSMYQMVVIKQIMNSKFKFYNLTSYEVDYDETTPDYYYLQTIISYDLPKGFGIGIGANLQLYNAFKPLVAVSYSHFTESIGFVLQPSYEIDKDGAFEFYSLFEWTPTNKKKIQPYFKVSVYSAFKDEHSYSYHNWRLGINYKSFRIGPAMNVQYYGKNATSNYNFGGFVNILIN